MAAVTANNPTELEEWIEIFHSKPSMKHCYLLEKLPHGKFSSPARSNELKNADYIREGFRVFRLPARRIEFVLTNGSNRNWEDNYGANYIVDSPGRYVVEHGIRRVGDANAAECAQATLRTEDQYIQIEFRADLWEKCFCCYQVSDEPWTPAPGVEMRLVEKGVEGRYFQIEVKAKSLSCAFNNGGEIWDSNLRKNYKMGHPGKYTMIDGRVVYLEPADKDKTNPAVKVSLAKQVKAPVRTAFTANMGKVSQEPH